MKVFAASSLSILILTFLACGGSSSNSQATGALSGNWQLNLTEEFPRPPAQLFAGGFLAQPNGSTLTGSVQGPFLINLNGSGLCGGVGTLTGTVNGQNVSFSLNPGGTVFNFSGVIASGSQSMSGSYQALGGACFSNPTSGTWTATLIPPLNGSFTGTLMSQYMATLNGASSPVPVSVSGSITQSSNAGGATASVTGTITAVNYPCFATASMVGTISGQNVYLNLYDYTGTQIGTLGYTGGPGSVGNPATVQVATSGVSLVDTADSGSGLFVGSCPAIQTSNAPVSTDNASVTLNF